MQMVMNSTGTSVCITKGCYNDRVEMEEEDSTFRIEGQNKGGQDWILQMALELGKPIHLFYRAKASHPFSYMGLVDNNYSFVTQEYIAGENLLEAVLFADRGSSTMVDVGISTDPSYKYKKAVFEHIGVNPADVFPRCVIPCFHLLN